MWGLAWTGGEVIVSSPNVPPGPEELMSDNALPTAKPGAAGAFTFVLHSHLPYVRQAGRWPHGEEWIHEAASETYVPLLRALWDLRDEGVPFKSTIGVTPVLAAQ